MTALIRRYKSVALLPLMLVTVLMLTACQRAQVAQPLTQTAAGNDMESQMEFWHTLAQRRLVSNDEAFHALLLFFNNEDPAQSYADRVALLKSRDMLPQDFDEPAELAVTRGILAQALLEAMQIKGGVILRVFGTSQRYALKELAYRGIMPPSSAQQSVSGDQLVGIIGRAEDYLRMDSLRAAVK